MSLDLLEKVLADQPKLHFGETEVEREFRPSETFLDPSTARRLSSHSPICHGIEADVARFIYDSIDSNSKSLETGAGISTLIFALKESAHTAVTPNSKEIEAIREYALRAEIPLSKVTFVAEPSEAYLPRLPSCELDLLLIDGKHAFPWPIIDWFYTADNLRKGGLMILDDVNLHSVAILSGFMREDPCWRFLKSFGRRTVVFRKAEEAAHDVAWHMQPYLTKRLSFRARLGNRLRRLLS